MDRALLKEERIHGNPMYPVSVYVMEDLDYTTIMDSHWHEEMEFTIVTRGTIRFQIGTEYYEVSQGEAMFVHGGELHAGHRVGDEPCAFAAVVFNGDFLSSRGYDALQERFIEPLLQKKSLPPSHLTGREDWERDILGLIAAIISDNERSVPAYQLMTKARLYQIFALLQQHMRENVPAAAGGDVEKIERLKKVLGHMHHHYPSPIKLGDLAGLLNMSEGHFCRFFKSMVHKSPVDYLNRYRTQQACRLLENSGHKIVEIAMEVGFDSLSYFISVFKQHQGCTPSQYRKRLKAAAEASRSPTFARIEPAAGGRAAQSPGAKSRGSGPLAPPSA
ncbi:AraC family transcriptional regulator [Saccharibacillus brassicae]|uniref:Helix-turn-helix domain-containing protein n=1 Tax=Saccharibacillus brassicae TaxID=2583377 RepID=A0A4Y6V281_SACBS|nr:AraC family transcriptional regulator [Saccharibacillus brassicae]QDH22776.1 helix-turn-helix domain-containing protein [Saccharibacillus brassicae]